MNGYKLVDRNYYTRRDLPGETLWEIEKEVHPDGSGTGSCGPGVFHDYADPLLANLLNPIHAAIPKPRLLMVRHSIEPKTDGLKRWTTGSLYVLGEMSVREISVEQSVKFALSAVLEFCGPPKDWGDWADGWMLNYDRTIEASSEATRIAIQTKSWPQAEIANITRVSPSIFVAATVALVSKMAGNATKIAEMAGLERRRSVAQLKAQAARIVARAAELRRNMEAWSPSSFEKQLIEAAEKALTESEL